MKTLLILILCSISFIGHSQVKDYYTKNGEISTLKTKSSTGDTYICKIVNELLVSVYNKNNKLTNDYPRRKDGSETNDKPQIVQDDNAIIFRIVEPILKKYSFDIYKHRTPSAEIKDFVNILTIYVLHNSDTGDVLEMRFSFANKNNKYAPKLPIEAYAEMDREIKKYGKSRVTEEGRQRVFCMNWIMIHFKPKQE